MKADKRAGFMERLAGVIVDKRNIIFLIFAALAIFCAFSRNWGAGLRRYNGIPAGQY